MGKATVVTDSDFEQIVLRATTPVLVDFWATWCRPCQMVAPVLEELADEYKGKLTIAKLDVDQNAETATKYHVMSIPTMIVFKNGKPVSNFVGFRPKEQLKKDLDGILG